MPPANGRHDTSWLPTVVPTVQALLDQGEATRGLTVKTWGGHLIWVGSIAPVLIHASA